MQRPDRAVAIVLVLLTGFLVRSLQAEERLPGARPDQVGLSKEKLERVDALLQDHVDRKQIAGAVAVVVRHGKVAYQSAVGMQDVEAGIAMSPESIFRIASMTKPITSTAVMMLAEQGRIDLSDPISRYLPEFKFMQVAMPKQKKDAAQTSGDSSEEYELVPAYRPITIRDLLTHTSGLCYRFRNHALVGRLYSQEGICDGLSPCDHSLADNVRRLTRLPLAHQPGTAWEYGLSTDVLGRLIEVVSGKSLDAFFAERIFTPLEMNDTHFVLPESKRGRLAALYKPGAGGTISRTGDGPTALGGLIYAASLPYRGTAGYFSGGAGLVSTAGDYARFLQMLLNRGERQGTRILRPETVQAMTRDQTGGLPLWILVHGSRFGYGFGIHTQASADIRKDPVGTFGWGGIYYTDFWVDRQHELIGIMMTQIYPSGHLKLRDEFHRLVNESVQP
ncbi:MAG: serine hydrolase domain-containing protein [Isosphaerales bacterium]